MKRHLKGVHKVDAEEDITDKHADSDCQSVPNDEKRCLENMPCTGDREDCLSTPPIGSDHEYCFNMNKRKNTITQECGKTKKRKDSG